MVVDLQLDGAINRLLKTENKVQDGAPKIAKLPYKWLYGRYNYG